jgi:hypothetical protein
MPIKPCDQKKCALLGNGLCPRCDGCKCPPNYINDICTECWNCLKDEGYVRSGVPDAEVVMEEEPCQNQI